MTSSIALAARRGSGTRRQSGRGGRSATAKDCLPAQPLRAARPVPMLVEAVDAIAHRVGKAQRARDVGSAGTARLDQVLRDGVAVLKDIANRRRTAMEWRAAGGFAGDETERCGQSGPDCLKTLFEGEIVGLVQFADARGVLLQRILSSG